MATPFGQINTTTLMDTSADVDAKIGDLSLSNSEWISFGGNVQTTSSSYEKVASFIFPGTSVVPDVSKINALVRRNGSADSMSIRIYDVTNMNSVAELTGVTNTDEAVISDLGAISNLPAGEATFEVQLLVVGSPPPPIGNPFRAFCSALEFRG
jgi:hypothetical protein